MTQIAIITACYDRYDTIKPVMPQTGVDVEWICVHDDMDLDPADAPGWRMVYQPRPGIHPNRAAKHPKCEPWNYTDAPVSLWVDASFRIVSDRFALEATAMLTDDEPIAQFVHPWRDCIYTETTASYDLPKYQGEPGLQQASAYREHGHPEHWGLWATGVMGRRHTEAVRKMGWLWLAEIYRWSFQDQISHPYALREHQLRPQALPGTHLANSWLQYEGSGRH
jgi:hypothetical protein